MSRRDKRGRIRGPAKGRHGRKANQNHTHVRHQPQNRMPRVRPEDEPPDADYDPDELEIDER